MHLSASNCVPEEIWIESVKIIQEMDWRLYYESKSPRNKICVDNITKDTLLLLCCYFCAFYCFGAYSMVRYDGSITWWDTIPFTLTTLQLLSTKPRTLILDNTNIESCQSARRKSMSPKRRGTETGNGNWPEKMNEIRTKRIGNSEEINPGWGFNLRSSVRFRAKSL